MMGGSYESFEEKLEAAENGDEDAAGYSELFKSAEQNLQKAAEAYKKAAEKETPLLSGTLPAST